VPPKPTDHYAATVLAARIGDHCRFLRRLSGQTQADVAEQVELAREVYARIERGRALPSMPTLLRLARQFGSPIEQFLLPAADDALLPGLDAGRRRDPAVVIAARALRGGAWQAPRADAAGLGGGGDAPQREAAALLAALDPEAIAGLLALARSLARGRRRAAPAWLGGAGAVGSGEEQEDGLVADDDG
jgi:transcriptional regulator with XRE-family HTH domain